MADGFTGREKSVPRGAGVVEMTAQCGGSGLKGALLTVCFVCLITLLLLHTSRYELSGPGSFIHEVQLQGDTELLQTTGGDLMIGNTSSGHHYTPAEEPQPPPTDPHKTSEKRVTTKTTFTATAGTRTTTTQATTTTTTTKATQVASNLFMPKKAIKPQGARWSTTQYQRDQINNVHWTEAMSQEVREELARREAGVEAGCRSHLLLAAPKPKLTRVVRKLMHVKERSFVWCPVFKAASTTWAKNLLRLAGNKNTKAFQNTARSLYPPPRQLHHLPKDTSWLIIVRHPLQRLLSAYRDKMLRQRMGQDPYEQLQREVVATYKDPNSTPSSNDTHVPTFTQFLMKVKDDVQKVWKGKTKHVNQHWSPYWLLCAPCQLHYSLIAHVETFTRDQEYLIHHLHMEDQAVNIHSHASNFDSYEGTDEATHHYYSQVPRDLLQRIVQLYLPDFVLFGYSPEPYLRLQPT